MNEINTFLPITSRSNYTSSLGGLIPVRLSTTRAEITAASCWSEEDSYDRSQMLIGHY